MSKADVWWASSLLVHNWNSELTNNLLQRKPKVYYNEVSSQFFPILFLASCRLLLGFFFPYRNCFLDNYRVRVLFLVQTSLDLFMLLKILNQSVYLYKLLEVRAEPQYMLFWHRSQAKMVVSRDKLMLFGSLTGTFFWVALSYDFPFYAFDFAIFNFIEVFLELALQGCTKFYYLRLLLWSSFC